MDERVPTVVTVIGWVLDDRYQPSAARARETLIAMEFSPDEVEERLNSMVWPAIELGVEVAVELADGTTVRTDSHVDGYRTTTINPRTTERADVLATFRGVLPQLLHWDRPIRALARSGIEVTKGELETLPVEARLATEADGPPMEPGG
jgi:hypothetical protein